jgi:hypothetical protein
VSSVRSEEEDEREYDLEEGEYEEGMKAKNDKRRGYWLSKGIGGGDDSS